MPLLWAIGLEAMWIPDPTWLPRGPKGPYILAHQQPLCNDARCSGTWIGSSIIDRKLVQHTPKEKVWVFLENMNGMVRKVSFLLFDMLLLAWGTLVCSYTQVKCPPKTQVNIVYLGLVLL